MLDEPSRAGFAYGTLPGHPERGEEAFVVRLLDDGSVRFDVVAFSRPGSTLTRLAGPIGRAVQYLAAGEYLQALRRYVDAGADGRAGFGPGTTTRRRSPRAGARGRPTRRRQGAACRCARSRRRRPRASRPLGRVGCARIVQNDCSLLEEHVAAASIRLTTAELAALEEPSRVSEW